MKHFSIEEFIFSQTATRYGIDNSLKTQQLKDNAEMTLDFLEVIRRILGHPIYISSGYRCEALNKILHGAPSSQHKKAEAADILCPGHGSPRQVCLTILDHDVGFDQLIYEGRWVHISRSTDPRGKILTASFTSQGTRYSEGIV